MNIIPLSRIAQQAESAARLTAQSGILQPNPYPPESDAAVEWKRLFELQLLAASAEVMA